MSENAGSIVYRVDVNTGAFISGMNTVNKNLDTLEKNFDRAERGASSLGGGLSKLSVAIAGVATVESLRRLQQMSEEFTLLRARIDRFSGGVRQGAENYERLLAISSKTGSDMGTAVKTWEALTGSLKEMGKSNADILTITDSLMKMGTLGGASAEEMKNGLRQLGQSFSGGIIRGEEFNSVLENTPEIARQLAKGLGVPFSELRQMMLDGKLTAELVFDALLKRTAEVNADFEKMPRTVAQASNAIRNEFGSALAKLDQEAGFSKTLAQAIDLVASKIADFGKDAEGLASAVDLIGNAASSFAAIMAGRVLTSLGTAAAAQINLARATMASVAPNVQAAQAALALARAEFDAALAAEKAAQARAASSVGLQTYAGLQNAAAIASERTTVAGVRLAGAMGTVATQVTVASFAMRGLNSAMAFLGGPTGVILLAAYALYEFSKASRDTKVDVDALNSSLGKLTFNQLAKASNDAGDDIEKLNKRLSESMSDLRTATARPFESDEGFAKRKTEMQAEFDSIQQQIKARRDLQAAIKTQQEQITTDQTKAPDPSKPKEHKTSAEDKKVLDNLKEQAALARLAGEARARLAAEQKLSATATNEEKKAAGDLAVEIYKLETAKKEGKKSESDAARQKRKDDAEAKRNTEQNAEAIRDYAVGIGMAAMKGEDLARAQAQAKLNKFATPEDVKTMDNLARAMWQVEQAQKAKQNLASVDPMANEALRYEEELKMLNDLNAQKALSDERYYQLKTAAALAHDEQVKMLEEQAFIRQSAANAFLMSSIEALGQTTTQAITGLINGTMTAQDVMRSFASTILNEAVSALVQMGIQAIKQALIQKTAQAAAAASYVAGVSAQVATTTALAAQAAFASTAAIPVVGPAAAPAAATAAGTAASALGAPAVASAAGVAAGRLYGGDVAADSMYSINENGAPEIFNADNGKQYMMPNQNGEVVSNKNATAGGGMIVNININVDSGGESSTSTNGGQSAQDLASQFEGMTLTIMQRETAQGGILWNMQNER